ncbi:hypothetical protein DOY81_001723, partial [Sarcophaga bullata]
HILATMFKMFTFVKQFSNIIKRNSKQFLNHKTFLQFLDLQYSKDAENTKLFICAMLGERGSSYLPHANTAARRSTQKLVR